MEEIWDLEGGNFRGGKLVHVRWWLGSEFLVTFWRIWALERFRASLEGGIFSGSGVLSRRRWGAISFVCCGGWPWLWNPLSEIGAMGQNLFFFSFSFVQLNVLSYLLFISKLKFRFTMICYVFVVILLCMCMCVSDVFLTMNCIKLWILEQNNKNCIFSWFNIRSVVSSLNKIFMYVIWFYTICIKTW